MTPIQGPKVSVISPITVGWLEDIGYAVDFGAADAYPITELNSTSCVCDRRRLDAPVLEVKEYSDAKKAAIAAGKAKLASKNPRTNSIAVNRISVLYEEAEDGLIHSVIVSE